MHIKKSELYSPLWQSCDEHRGGLDPSQYKDCVRGMVQELLMGRMPVT